MARNWLSVRGSFTGCTGDTCPRFALTQVCSGFYITCASGYVTNLWAIHTMMMMTRSCWFNPAFLFFSIKSARFFTTLWNYTIDNRSIRRTVGLVRCFCGFFCSRFPLIVVDFSFPKDIWITIVWVGLFHQPLANWKSCDTCEVFGGGTPFLHRRDQTADIWTTIYWVGLYLPLLVSCLRLVFCEAGDFSLASFDLFCFCHSRLRQITVWQLSDGNYSIVATKRQWLVRIRNAFLSCWRPVRSYLQYASLNGCLVSKWQVQSTIDLKSWPHVMDRVRTVQPLLPCPIAHVWHNAKRNCQWQSQRQRQR